MFILDSDELSTVDLCHECTFVRQKKNVLFFSTFVPLDSPRVFKDKTVFPNLKEYLFLQASGMVMQFSTCQSFCV